MMTLGIPGDTMTAILMAALLIHGLQPGPFLFQNNPGFVSYVYSSLFIAIFFTLIFGLIMIKFIVKLLNSPKKIVNISIIVLCIFWFFRNKEFNFRCICNDFFWFSRIHFFPSEFTTGSACIWINTRPCLGGKFEKISYN